MNRSSHGPQEVLLRAVGDLMLGDGHYHIGEGVAFTVSREGPDFLFENVAPFLRRADLCLGNLEVPLSRDSEAVGPRSLMFRGSPECAHALRRAGFHALSVANNHILDHGVTALRDTLTYLGSAGIVPLGVRSENGPFQSEPHLVEVGGLRFVLLGYWFTRKPTRSVAIGSPETLVEDLVNVDKAFHPDRKVLSVHWGDEYAEFPSPTQLRTAERIASVTQNVILLGHHPHVIQGVEVKENSLFAYSLGNFIFDANFCPDVMRGAVLSVSLSGRELRGFRLTPVRIGPRHRPSLAPDDKELTKRFDAAVRNVGRFRGKSEAEYARYTRRRLFRKRLAMWGSLLRRHTNVPKRTARFVITRKLGGK